MRAGSFGTEVPQADCILAIYFQIESSPAQAWLAFFLGEAHMQSLIQDLRFAFRQMTRSPGFSLTAILSLALGIGATVSVFSVIYSAVLNAWPYADFDRACQIDTIGKSGNEGDPGFTG